MPSNSSVKVNEKKSSQRKVQEAEVALRKVEKIIHEGKFDEAHHKIKKLEQKANFQGNKKLQSQILKSYVLVRSGKFDEGLELIEEIFYNNRQFEPNFLIVEAILSKALAFLELGDLVKCIEAIEKAESIQKKIEGNESEYSATFSAKLKYLKGKVYGKKGAYNLAYNLLQESLSITQELGHTFETADILNNIGTILGSKGEFTDALSYLQRSLKVFQKLKNRGSVVKVLNNLGMINWKTGDLDQALEHYQESVRICEEIGNKHHSAVLSLNIGIIYRDKGELSNAHQYYQKALSIFELLNKENEKSICLNNIGHIYLMKGELNLSLQFFNNCLEIAEKLQNNQEIAMAFVNIANVFESQGELKNAMFLSNKSLELYKEIGNNFDIAFSLYNLVRISISAELLKEAENYLQQLEEINKKEKNKLINQRYRVAKAMRLKMSDRVVKRAEAQQLFQQIVQEEIINYELTVHAMLNLCELLLVELRGSGLEEVLIEVKTLIQQHYEIAEKQPSYLWLASSYLLQSKLALMELDVEGALQLLSQAQALAEAKELYNLASLIITEKDSLVNQISKWQKFVEEKPPMKEIIDLTQFEDLLKRMINKRLYRKEEDVIEYAAKAKALIERWEED
ncbi:MAG: tetratricopeptide repeat protein [Candidatus Hodarchaeales archaeon]